MADLKMLVIIRQMPHLPPVVHSLTYLPEHVVTEELKKAYCSQAAKAAKEELIKRYPEFEFANFTAHITPVTPDK